nr:hypothetical protein CFP56_07758 [Quercus suber]
MHRGLLERIDEVASPFNDELVSLAVRVNVRVCWGSMGISGIAVGRQKSYETHLPQHTMQFISGSNGSESKIASFEDSRPMILGTEILCLINHWELS